MAASLPAMRPNTVPIVMPNPARYPRPRMLPAITSPAPKTPGSGEPSSPSTRAASSPATPRQVERPVLHRCVELAHGVLQRLRLQPENTRDLPDRFRFNRWVKGRDEII